MEYYWYKKLREGRLGQDSCEDAGSWSTVPFSLCPVFLSYSYWELSEWSFWKEKGYIPFSLIASCQILTLKDRNRRASGCRQCYDFYTYFLMQNGHFSQHVFIYVLGNLEEKKAELKELICMQTLLQALLGHKVVVVSLYIQRLST